MPISVTTSKGTSGTSRPVFLQPDTRKIGAGFDLLQPFTGIGNKLQGQAVSGQLNLRETANQLLSQSQGLQNANIAQGFQKAGGQVTSQLLGRGFDPSLLSGDVQRGVQREVGLSQGDVSDRILGRRIENQTGTANKISELLFGSSGQATNLIGALLGAGGVGSISSSKTEDPISVGIGTAAPSAPFEPFGGGPSPFTGGLLRTPAGGPGGSPGGEPGTPQTVDNPHVVPPSNLIDPDGDPDDPDNWATLHDRGPLQDPEKFAENQKELDRRQAIIDARLAAGGNPSQGPPPQTSLLAQSAQGTQTAIAQGGSLA